MLQIAGYRQVLGLPGSFQTDLGHSVVGIHRKEYGQSGRNKLGAQLQPVLVAVIADIWREGKPAGDDCLYRNLTLYIAYTQHLLGSIGISLEGVAEPGGIVHIVYERIELVAARNHAAQPDGILENLKLDIGLGVDGRVGIGADVGVAEACPDAHLERSLIILIYWHELQQAHIQLLVSPAGNRHLVYHIDIHPVYIERRPQSTLDGHL